MGRKVAAAIGVVMVAVGVLWTLQGLGHVGGSAMSGNETWAIVGPAFAGLGVALVWVSLGRRGS